MNTNNKLDTQVDTNLSKTFDNICCSINKKNIIELSSNNCLILEDIDVNLSEANLLHLFNFLLEIKFL